MSKWSVAVVVAGLALAAHAASAYADRPWTGYVITGDPADHPPSTAAIGPGTIIYLNKNGGTFKPGQDDSRSNTSGVPVSTSTLSPFNCSEAVWQQVMACVKDQFEPYNVTITDQDPGNTPHVESVVAGSPTQMKTQQYPNGLPCGQQGCVGGIAPLGCGLYLANPITYSFANIYNCNAQSICETVAQETAHAFGLDHENYCPDPMTYKTGCGAKKFQNYDAPCGEYSNRKCQCDNASTQNSDKMLRQIFGAGGDDAPHMELVKPADGAVVTPGFTIEGSASDDKGLTRVELYVDGSLVDMRTAPPFIFDAPASLGEGSHQIRLRAVDSANMTAEDSATVTLQAPCTGNDSCPDGYVCQAGECLPGPNMTGGLGSPCTDGSMCASGICAQGPDGSRCVQLCTPGASGDCPDGFTCLGTGGGQGACWPGEDALDPDGSDPQGGCGCRAGGQTTAPGAFVLALVGLAIALRPRQRPGHGPTRRPGRFKRLS